MGTITSDLESLSFQATNHQLIIIDHQWMIRSCNRAWQHGLHKLFIRRGQPPQSLPSPDGSMGKTTEKPLSNQVREVPEA